MIATEGILKTFLLNSKTCAGTERSVERMQLKHNVACQSFDQTSGARRMFLFCEKDSTNCKLKACQLKKRYACRFLGAKKRHANSTLTNTSCLAKSKYTTGNSVTEDSVTVNSETETSVTGKPETAKS